MKKKIASHAAFINSRLFLGALCLVAILFALVALLAFPGAASKAQASRQNADLGTPHKISIRDRGLAQTVKSQGAREIADYGSFMLLEVNDALANSLSNNPEVDLVDENNMVLLNTGTIDTRTPEAKSLRSVRGTKSGKQMRLVQFAGPIRPEWYEALAATGAQIVTYIPSNTYLVYGTAEVLEAVRKFASDSSMVQWDGDYSATYRVDPAIMQTTGSALNISASGNEQFAIQMVEDASENAATLALIEQSRLEPIIKESSMLGYFNVTAALPRDVVIHQLAERGDVVSIQPWITPILNCERQDIIMTGNITGNPAVPFPSDYLNYLTSRGFAMSPAANFGVNVSDTGLDNGTTTPFQFLLYTLGDATNAVNSRVSYVTAQGSAGAGDRLGCHGHGNINCTIIGGYVPTGLSGGVNFSAFPHADASGFRWGLGVAPFVKVGLSVIFDTGGNYTFPSFSTLESQAYAAGMRISSNSWGAPVGGAYTSDSQAYDTLVRDAQSGTAGNQEYTIVFSAGNDGSGGTTIGSPGTAKNVITVGAAENVNPFGGQDGSGVADSGANNANDIIGFSSRGPCTDLRKKPDIMGPGTHVSGGAPQNAANPARTGNGTVLACFTGGGVSGGVFPNKFFPAGQQWYTASSGTSHSCPAAAGAAALYRQHFINQSLTPPSPAMIKALMMNSARYMTGTGANDQLPSNNQGMGEISLNNFFDTFTTAHVFHDQTGADLITATGQVRTVTGSVSTAAKPFRVTLAWTDTPGPTSGNAYVNNLDLQVVVGGNTYRGNVFSAVAGNGFSVTGGAADVRNNVESVFVPAGVTGAYTVTVTGTNIAGNGVPGNPSALDQDFALVIYNGTETGAPTPTPTSTPSPTPTPTPTPALTPSPTPPPTATPIPVTVQLPIASVNTATTNFSQPVTATNINASDNLIGFQGDFTFNETIVTFQNPPVTNAGLTGGNWNVSANILAGGGPIRTLRVLAFSNDGVTPLSGAGTLYQLNLTRVSSTPGANTALTWAASPNDFQFINTDLESRIPNSAPPGSITIIAAPTATPTPTPTPTPTATATPPLVISIDGTTVYCSSPTLNPVPGVTMTLTGTSSATTATNASGNYTFAGLPSGGNYTVTPTKTALPPGTGINTSDVLGAQRHFLGITPIPAGCRLAAADVNGDTAVTTSDVIAIQRFFLGFTSGTANVGKYSFNPINRGYAGVTNNQTGQNYDVLIFGDVASSFVHRPTGPSQDAPELPPTVALVSLPEMRVDRSKNNTAAAVTTSTIDQNNNLVGFQGDFTFDERVVTFETEPVQKAGLTSGNWNVSGNVLPGAGPIRTLRISAYSTDFEPLSGQGTLFELRVNKLDQSGQRTPLIWAASPNEFIFIDADLNLQRPGTAPAGSAAVKM